MKYFIPILFLFLVFACKKKEPKNIAPKAYKEDFSAFDQKIAALAKELAIENYTYAIISDKQILHEEGNKEIIYPIGSLSTVFAGVLAFQLIEEEKLGLKENANLYIEDNEFKNWSIKQIMANSFYENKQFIFNPQNYNVLATIMEKRTGKTISELFKKNIAKKSAMDHTIIDSNSRFTESIKTKLSDLVRFSIALDKQQFFKNENTYHLMLRPVYLENGELNPAGTGWFTQFYNNKKFIWAFGEGKGYSSLILKSLNDSLSLILLADSENMNKAFDLAKGNIFKSPIAVEFVKRFSFKNDTIPELNLNSNDQVLKEALEKARISKHRNLLICEYASYIKMGIYMKNEQLIKRLSAIYEQSLENDIPVEMFTRQARAIISDPADYLLIKRDFVVENDTVIEIFAVGEYTKEITSNIWEYDNVELYFDIPYNRSISFNDTFHRQYRFNYDLEQTTGDFLSNENILFAQGENSKESYLFEIAIPWGTLSLKNPSIGKTMGFDISVSDRDSNFRKNYITWHFQKADQAWANPSVFGKLVLSDKPIQENDSLVYSVKTNSSFQINGKVEPQWNNAFPFKLNRTVFDTFPKPEDLSVRFRSLWDEKAIYFLVEVRDNIKNKYPITSDFGWIENERNDTVWLMKEHESLPAGGELGNRYVYTKIPLRKGKYILNYQTNQTNSYLESNRKRPDISFYGIAIY